MLGWTEECFWRSDPHTFAVALKARGRYQSEMGRAIWEAVRWHSSISLAPHNKGRAVAVQKLLRFPWERREVTKIEDYGKVANKLGKTIKNGRRKKTGNN